MTLRRGLLKTEIRSPWSTAAGLLLPALVFILGPGSHAQQEVQPVERVYNHSRVEVEKALQTLQAYATSRLPVLDGFVSANADTLKHFENPHYQFRIAIEAQGPVQTVVQVSAKVTAWYADADPVHAQYVVIPSNGRLEEDLLDRLSIYLEKGNPRAAGPAAPPAALAGAAAEGASPSSPGTSQTAAAGNSSPPLLNPDPPATAGASAEPATLASEIAAVEAQRTASEEAVRKLQQQISELEANSKSQKFLSNLATIKAAQTPVFDQADETSKILFRADAEDEFEVIDAREGWVRVRLESAAEGWLRISQLQPPGQVDDADDVAALNFSTPNEEVKPFSGEWAPLKGKPVLFVFAKPARELPPGTLGQSQRDFAKHAFTDGYRAATHSGQIIAGVVVVFLGVKGGVAAAALPDIRRWRDGLLSDKLFLDRCSLDPPESFRDTPKR
jgi:hypothetical protein